MTIETRTRPLVVISNDDGVQAPALVTLAQEAQERFEVLVVAPSVERSASSHSVSMVAEWMIHRHAPNWYGVDGSPADCVYLAICQLAPRPPALVISGINRGYNLGTDVFYSGTVAAAAEAAILGVPAIAISAESVASALDIGRAARFGVGLAAWILDEGWSTPYTLLNVNVPAGASDEFSLGSQGIRDYPRAARVQGPVASGAVLRMQRPPLSGADGSVGEDAEIVRGGHIAVTPLRLDWTHRDELLRLSSALQVSGFRAARREG